MLDELKSHFCRFTALENLYRSKNPQSFAAGEKWQAASMLKVHANTGLSLQDTALINAEGVGESGAVVAGLEDQVVWALWERVRCGETDFYNEKEQRFTRLDLFSLPPPFSLNHSVAPCTRLSNYVTATWL